MDYREISRIGGDPALVRATAATVRRLISEHLTPWQDNFLTKLEHFEGPDRLSTRQCETLISLRDGACRRKEVGGYRASRLIEGLYELRLDLSEVDETFVTELRNDGPDVALSDPQWKHVLGLCRQQGLIDDPFIPLH